MAINSIEAAIRYSDELDRLFSQKSVTGFFADNTLSKKFVGGKTVMIPDVDFQGLADYDRDSGFSRGAIRISNSSYTMQMDRARSLQIDRDDLDETGVAGLAGKVLGEYVRTKVVPECDAYVLSKLAGLAISRANTVEGETDKPYETLCELINSIRSAVGYDEELVAFIDSAMYAKLQNSSEISRSITVSEFKQGDINLTVKSLNGVALIPVVPERMKTAYDFHNTENGGFSPAENAKEIYMLVCPKNSAHLVKKTENMRIFTPEQNLDADAYKFDYRIYYDIFVKNSGLDSIWAWISPEIKITAQPSDKTVTEGSVSGSITVTVSPVPGSTLSYQWYECADVQKNRRVKIAGANKATFTLPTDMAAGKHYFFAVVTVDGLATSETKVAEITVSAA